jgi:hypothetical protein
MLPIFFSEKNKNTQNNKKFGHHLKPTFLFGKFLEK